MTHYHDRPWQIISRGDNSGQMLSSLAHSSLEVYCSYRLKFFVAKNHLRSSSLSFLAVILLDHVQHALLKGLSRKCVQKKKTPGSESELEAKRHHDIIKKL